MAVNYETGTKNTKPSQMNNTVTPIMYGLQLYNHIINREINNLSVFLWIIGHGAIFSNNRAF